MNPSNFGTQLNAIGLLAMQNIASSQTSNTGVDIRDYVGDIVLSLTAKNTAGTSPTMAIKIQESDSSGADFTDISGAAFTTVTDAGSLAAVQQTIIVKASQTKRYIRAHVTIGGTNSPAFDTALYGYAVKQYRST